MENKSHLTAIGRKNIPVPTRWLQNRALLFGTVLDYGCGKCHEINQKYILGCDGYDPYFRPDGITKTEYHTIICNYVLCVIPTVEARLELLRKIQDLLSPRLGKAYISVRNDVPKQGFGLSARGTYQADVRLDLKQLKTPKQFRTYVLTKKDVI